MGTRFCATDKRSAITGGNACRPDRSRKAVKRPGYTGVAPTAPESDQLMSGVISGILRCPGECAAISGRNQFGALVIAGPAIENTPLFCALSSAEFRFTFQVPAREYWFTSYHCTSKRGACLPAGPGPPMPVICPKIPRPDVHRNVIVLTAIWEYFGVFILVPVPTFNSARSSIVWPCNTVL